MENVIELREHKPYERWTQEEKDQEEREFFESASRYMTECEERWRTKGFTILSWIDEKPGWVHAADFGMILEDFWDEPTKPFTRIHRLSLIGGGQIKVMEHFNWWPSWAPRSEQRIGHDKTNVVVTVHDSDGVK